MPELPIRGGRIPATGAGAWLASRSEGTRLHAGVDIAAPPGTAVLAPEDGTVVLAVATTTPAEVTAGAPARPWAGYGPGVVGLMGASGVVHLLAHLAPPAGLRVGQHVAMGAVVGRVGRLSSGHHLHWEVRDRLRPGRDTPVEVSRDPAAWLRGEQRRYLDLTPPPCPRRIGPRSPRRCRSGSHPHRADPDRPSITQYHAAYTPVILAILCVTSLVAIAYTRRE
jgi:murein DD-endopeptidase MepM/ murein hydrolase activator NlpD